MDLSNQILNKRVVGICHSYVEQSIRINFEDRTSIIFNSCVIAFDLGIVGHVVSFVSFTGTLGMTLELKKMNKDPDEYNYIILSRDIKDIENKNELLISYKSVKIESLS